MPHEQIPTWSRDPRRGGSLAPLAGSRHKIFDAHLHVVNFIQQSPGGEALISHMDKANVSRAVIFGLPVTKMWDEWEREPPDYYLANDGRCYYYALTDVLVARLVMDLPAQRRERLYPLLCGFNPTDRYAVRHVERMLELYPGFWRGIGELLLRHDDLTGLTVGEAPRANHKALWPIYQLAADRDLPVLIHQNVTSVTKSDHPIYLHELEDALRDFPRTRFVLAHCGMSRRVAVPFYHRMVRRLLHHYPNLSLDYSWIIFDTVICPNGRPDQDWIALTEEHSRRICLGSDLVARFERLGPELQRYDVFLRELGPKTRENVCFVTAERIYGRRRESEELTPVRPPPMPAV